MERIGHEGSSVDEENPETRAVSSPVPLPCWKSVPKKLKDALWTKITVYYEIDKSKKSYVMPRLGELLRKFRSKMFQKFIKPHLENPEKLREVPKQFRTFVDQSVWDTFVVSDKQRQAREKSKYPHHLGRLGYDALREKLMQKEREIEKGFIELEPNTDTLSLVLGKEPCGVLRGVGMGVTAGKFWNLPRTRVSSKKRIAELELQLDAKNLQVNQLTIQSEKIRSHCLSIGQPLPADYIADLPSVETSLSNIHASSPEVSPENIVRQPVMEDNTDEVPPVEGSHTVTCHSDSAVDTEPVVITKVVNTVEEPPKKKAKQNVDTSQRITRR
ncbi:hypothetical protein OROMI_017439 [Orobanche minor]